SGLAEALDNAQALGKFQLFLLRSFGAHALANFQAQALNVDLAQQLLDSLGAHHGDKLSGELLVQLPLALVADHLAAADSVHLAGVDHDKGFEVQHPLQFAEGDVQQVADAAGEALEKPHMRAGAGQLDMPEALAADARKGYFDAALIADDAAVLHALILAAQALPVGDGTKNAGAEQAVALRLEGAVINRFRLGDLAVRPAPDFLRRRETDPNGIEVRDQIGAVIWRR